MSNDLRPPAEDWALGDVLVLESLAASGLLLVVAAVRDETPDSTRVVPFDPERLAGPGDLELDGAGGFGAGTLRCRHARWVSLAPLEPQVVGRLSPEELARLRETLAAVADGGLDPSPLPLERAELPEYRRREHEVRSAMVEMMVRIEPAESTPALPRRPFAPRADRANRQNTWRLAAVLLLGVSLLLLGIWARTQGEARELRRMLADERRLHEREIASLEDRVAAFEQGETIASLSGLPVVWLSPRPVLRSAEASESHEFSGSHPGWVLVLFVPKPLVDHQPLRLEVFRRSDEVRVLELEVRAIGAREVSVVLPKEQLPEGDYWFDLYRGDELLAEYALSTLASSVESP